MKKGIFVYLVIALLSVALVSSGCSAPQGASSTAGDTIKIGFLGGLTGNHAHYGIETLKGMQMAVDDLNQAGGLLGKQVEIIKGDHGSDSSQAASVTQKLITQGVVAIIGDPTTGITKLTAPICQSSKVVMMSAGAVGKGVVEIGDYIFRDCLLDAVAAPAVTDYLTKQLGWKKVIIVTTKGLDYSEGLTGIFKEALNKEGVQVVDEQFIQEKDTNFSAQVTAMSQEQFDGVIFTGYYTEGALFMKEMRKQGLKQVMAGGDGLLGKELWELGGDAVEGSMVYTGFFAVPDQATGKTKDFIKKYQDKNGGKIPDMFSAQGYDAVMLVADAIKAANSAEPARFREKLAQTRDWQGVTGNITFDSNREPIKSPVYLLEVKNHNFAAKAIIPVKK